jgi:hypothetical protein
MRIRIYRDLEHPEQHAHTPRHRVCFEAENRVDTLLLRNCVFMDSLIQIHPDHKVFQGDASRRIALRRGHDFYITWGEYRHIVYGYAGLYKVVRVGDFNYAVYDAALSGSFRERYTHRRNGSGEPCSDEETMVFFVYLHFLYSKHTMGMVDTDFQLKYNVAQRMDKLDAIMIDLIQDA